MLRFVGALLLVLAAPPARAAEEAISLRDAATFRARLHDLGYAPEAIEGTPAPTNVIQLQGEPFLATLGGCEDGRNCWFVMLSGSFSDVIDPPAEWLEKKNRSYDIVKLTVSDDKQLVYSVSVLGSVQGSAIPLSVFRDATELLVQLRQALARDIHAEGIPVTGKPQSAEPAGKRGS